jgi:hypothetical protein
MLVAISNHYRDKGFLSNIEGYLEGSQAFIEYITV